MDLDEIRYLRRETISHNEHKRIENDTLIAEEYVVEINSLADKLAVVHHPILKSELITCTLNRLQDLHKYQAFVHTIENRERPAFYDEHRARLLVHEQRLQHIKSTWFLSTTPAGSQLQEIAVVNRT
ncbi:unnamed protein product [Dovyalis caffra]|uniref:Uncharacterized protein n=1 Tax=Dovyalis caffra TaxID=77055 RepID=A0AAV1RMI5_9ROSI|nr:unnamed protein product [Dovyalis caffra]